MGPASCGSPAPRGGGACCRSLLAWIAASAPRSAAVQASNDLQQAPPPRGAGGACCRSLLAWTAAERGALAAIQASNDLQQAPPPRGAGDPHEAGPIHGCVEDLDAGRQE